MCKERSEDAKQKAYKSKTAIFHEKAQEYRIARILKLNRATNMPEMETE